MCHNVRMRSFASAADLTCNIYFSAQKSPPSPGWSLVSGACSHE
jgi:hypothetical protein